MNGFQKILFIWWIETRPIFEVDSHQTDANGKNGTRLTDLSPPRVFVEANQIADNFCSLGLCTIENEYFNDQETPKNVNVLSALSWILLWTRWTNCWRGHFSGRSKALRPGNEKQKRQSPETWSRNQTFRKVEPQSDQPWEKQGTEKNAIWDSKCWIEQLQIGQEVALA